MAIGDKIHLINKEEVQGAIGNINNPLLDLPLNNSLAMKQGVGSVEFTRSTTATYIDRYGILRTADVDEPRFEKDGLLIEGESTNLLIPSNLNDNEDLGFTRSAVVGLDGITDSAIRMTETTDENVQRRLRDTSLNSIDTSVGDRITSSVILKPYGDRTNICLLVDYNGSNMIEFRLSDNTIGAVSVPNETFISAGIEPLEDGWYKLTVTLEIINTGYDIGVWVFFSNTYGDGNSYYDGDGTSYIDFFGAQVEKLPFATSYIPTTDSAVTRGTDFCEVTFDGNMLNRKDNSTLMADYNIPSITEWAGGTIPRGMIGIIGEEYRYLRVNGTSTMGVNGFGYFDANNVNDSFRYASIDSSSYAKGYINGVATNYNSSSSVSIIGTRAIRLGGVGHITTHPLFGHIKNFRIYDRALTEQEVRLA